MQFVENNAKDLVAKATRKARSRTSLLKLYHKAAAKVLLGRRTFAFVVKGAV